MKKIYSILALLLICGYISAFSTTIKSVSKGGNSDSYASSQTLAAIAVSPLSFCDTLVSCSLGGNNPTTGTGLWRQISGPGTTIFSDSTDGTSIATVTVHGTYIYEWTISDSGYTPSSAQVTVNFSITPTVATAIVSQIHFHDKLVSDSLSGSSPVIGDGLWKQVSGPGSTTFDDETSGSTKATVSEHGSYVYEWTISHCHGTACPTSSAQVSIDFEVTPTKAIISTSPLNYCGNLESNSLGANAAIIGTGKWSQISGPGTTIFSDSLSNTATAQVSVYGTYVYEWTISHCHSTSIYDTCIASKARITVNYYDIPSTASVTSSVLSYCDTLTSTSLGGNDPTVGSGIWSQVSGPGTTSFSDTTSFSAIATDTVYGMYLYKWTISNGTCQSSDAQVTVHYFENPTTASLTTSSLNYCGTLVSAKLGGNRPTIGNGVWSQISGPGTTTFSSSISDTSVATASSYGKYIYQWTISNGNCASSWAQLTVNYYETPTTATVGSAQDFCDELESSSLDGNSASVGTGLWSQVSGPGTTTFSASTSGTSTATANTFGTYVYQWTISNGTCTASSDQVSVNFYATPTTASINTSSLDYCGTLVSSALGGNSPTYGTGLWSQVSGPGTTTFSASTNGSSTATASTYGTYIYKWTISNGICNSNSAYVTVNFYASPTIASITTSVLNYCGTLASDTLGGNTPTVGIGLWSLISGPGTTKFSSSISGSSSATANAYGTYIYQWTISNGTCTASTDQITVNYYETPSTATIASSILSYCGILETALLEGNIPKIGTGLWSQISGPGTTIFSDSTRGLATATASVYGTYTYQWTISNGTCAENTAQLTVNYYATPTPASIATSPLNYCGTLETDELGGNSPIIGTGLWRQLSGPGTTTFSNSIDEISTAKVTSIGTYVYQWTISNGICTTSSAYITVNYYASPTTAIVGETQNLCGMLESNELGGNTALIGTGIWSQLSGPDTSNFSAPTSGSSIATINSYGTYVYQWTISNGTCTPSSAQLTINYYEIPSQATSGGTQSICSNLISTSLVGNNPTVGTGLWSQISGPGNTIFSSPTTGSSTALASEYGTYYYQWIISNGPCRSNAALVMVNHYQTPSTASISIPFENCDKLTLNGGLGGNLPTVGTGLWNQVSGPGTTTFCNKANCQAKTTVNAYGLYEYQWTISNGNCPASTVIKTVVYYNTGKDILTLDPEAIGGTISDNKSICSGNTSGILKLTGYTGEIIGWQSSLDMFNTWTDIANTLPTYTSEAITQTTQFRAVVQNGMSTPQFSDVATIKVDEVPTSSFTYTVKDLKVTFTNQSRNTTSQLWNFGSGLFTSTDQNPIFAFSTGGQYSIELTTFNGQCSSYSTQLIDITSTGISDKQNTNSTNVYPTPSTGKVSIQFGNIINENTLLLVFDLTGKVVYSNTIMNLNSDNTFDIDLTSLPIGVYNVRVLNNQKIDNFKIMIER